MLLDLYLRHPNAEARHQEVAALSRLLRDLAGPPQADNFRNPVGIAMKLRNLAQQDPAFHRTGKAGLGHGNRLNAEIWALLADDSIALAAEVQRIRGERLPRSDGHKAASPSKGPVPSFGSFGVSRADGETEVYVLILDGARERLAQSPVPASADILKVGLSKDIQRRLGELNAGLPPILGIRWRLLWSTNLPSAVDAYEVEQMVLRSVHERGWSGAGEFVIAPTTALIAAIGLMLVETVGARESPEI